MKFEEQESMNEKTLSVKKKKGVWIAALLILLLSQLIVLVYYGTRKTGFHEDELYSYYTTNKTAGLFVNDRTWLNRDEFRNDFVVLPGEEFRYDVVKQMQSWDVHPPFYYYLLHTVCSLSENIFSKWQGILVNLLAFVPCFFLLFYLVWSCMTEEKERLFPKSSEGENTAASVKRQGNALFLAFAVCLFWGFGSAVISGVMFIRMYQWLTLFVLLCACLHIRAIKKESYGITFLLPLMLTVFLGFLTQYYYIIFHFFIGLGFCFLLLRQKKIKEIVLYGLSCAVGFGAAVLYYPACLSHIFRGYRGTEAVSEFSNAENTLDRLQFFAGLFDDYVMNGSLSIVLLLICLLWLTVSYLKKRSGQKADGRAEVCFGSEKTPLLTGLLLFAAVGYFFTISKTALLLGETSNRYQLPVYGIFLYLLLYYLTAPCFSIAGKRKNADDKAKSLKRSRLQAVAGGLFIAALLLLDVTALRSGKVFFLYVEEAEMIEFVKENRDVPVIVCYNDASPDNVWRISNQLMEVPRVYLFSQGNGDAITDTAITESDKLLVYVADYDNKENCLETILKSSVQLSGYREIAQKGLWTLYEME